MVLFPQLDQLTTGARFNVVCKAVVIASGGDHLFRTVETPGSFVFIRGDLPNPVNNYVFVGLKMVKEHNRIIGCIDENTTVIREHPCQISEMYNIVELCCGMGAFSMMGPLVGFQIKAGVDQNDKWKYLWDNGHEGTAKFFHGDVGDSSIVAELLKDGNLHSTLLSGVSCQPYSLAGDGRGMDDERSDSLPKTLMTAWLLQCPIVILECVPSVLNNDRFQMVLKEYCTRTGCHLTQQVLHLSHLWCARRDRWFGCITAHVLGPIRIDDLPKMAQYLKIEQVMPSTISWPSQEMEQLKLSLYELGKFDEFCRGGIEQSYINPQAQLPTVLHSNGNALYPCHCGCRPALSLQRLKEKGLFGTLVPLTTFVHHNGRWRQEARYLHPKDVFLLNGGLPSFDFCPDLRLGLAAVGQCVSPIQALWVLGHVADHLGKFAHNVGKDPKAFLTDYIVKLIAFRDEMWAPSVTETSMVSAGTSSAEDAQSEVQITITQDGFPPVSFSASPTCTIRDFLQAETKLRGQQVSVHDLENRQGIPFDESASLSQSTWNFRGGPKAAHKSSSQNAHVQSGVIVIMT